MNPNIKAALTVINRTLSPRRAAKKRSQRFVVYKGQRYRVSGQMMIPVEPIAGRKISEETERNRESYRCAFCGRFGKNQSDGFYDREDRADEGSSVLVFCNEAHAEAYHARKIACAQGPTGKSGIRGRG